jgi:hypothetical protein
MVVEPDYYYYSEDEDIDDEDLPILPIEPFRKRVNPKCFRNCLKEVYEYANEDEDLLRKIVRLEIYTEKDKVYIDLVDKWKCGAFSGCILK